MLTSLGTLLPGIASFGRIFAKCPKSLDLPQRRITQSEGGSGKQGLVHFTPHRGQMRSKFAIAGTSLLVLCLPGVVRADEPSAWSNPYASDAARRLLAEAQAADPGVTADDVYREIQIIDATTVNADGLEANASTVEWREVATDHESVPEEPATPTTPVITDELSNLFATADDDATVDVWISLRRSLYDIGGTYASHLAVAALEGSVDNAEDEAEFRADWITTRTDLGNLALDPVVEDALRAGGSTIESWPEAGVARLEVPVWFARELASSEDIAAVNLYREATDDDSGGYSISGVGGNLDGNDLEDLIQSGQFYDRSFHGTGTIGMMESNGSDVWRGHPGFEDGSSSQRFTNCQNVLSVCVNDNGSSGTPHATAVASVLLGDITDGQDTSFSGLDLERRSGVARRAHGFGVSQTYVSWGLARITGKSDDILMMNHSSSWEDDDPNCNGEDTNSRLFNGVFEDGVAVFQSSGNTGHSSTTDCTVSSPGSAIGVFTVVNYSVSTSSSDTIGSITARGGTSYQGRGRSIISMAAPTPYTTNVYPHYDRPDDPLGDPTLYGADWDDDGVAETSETFGQTSAATPVTTGAANVFRQWYAAVHSTAINNPGRLYVNMLLMGDREGASGRLFTGYDNLWGAGKLRLRAFDSTGLDGPDSWASSDVCVDSGTTVTLATDLAMNGDVDIYKATAWWYDRRHDDGTDNDQLTLKLQYRTSSSGSWTDLQVDSPGDNRQRVYLQDPISGWDYRLVISASTVTADDEGCGTNSMRVFWAKVFEDSDRESGEALDWVRPEDL